MDSLPGWQKEVAMKVRDLIHVADPEIQETIKRTILPFFTLNGNICALQTTKDHLNILVYDPIAPDPKGIINQGHSNQTARSIQIYRADQLDEDAFTELIKEVVSNNRSGGWRKLIRS